MRASGTTFDSGIIARATTGQRLDIRYDADTNSIVFIEDDWSADGLRGAPPRAVFSERLDSLKVKRLRTRRAA
jgi:hypothetical protein